MLVAFRRPDEVGLIVTPLGAWSTVAGAWPFGVTLCDIWISVDVIVCTASILHLVAIALDRYWSVTDISYVQNRTPKRIMIMLTVIWMTSLLISLAPFAGWKDDGFRDRVLRQHVCLISQQISYQSIGESSTSTQSEEDRTISHTLPEQETKLDDHVNHQGNGKSFRPVIGRKKRRSKETAENKRERKAWRTLAIITGYLNSALNPIIYTVFSQDFRAAFKKIIRRLCLLKEY
ncbi:7 transmembrane receptor [Teladorsagia circumcincta]|uniref:7 transmembrane receptor n=1 Tax=Teladorsagia circumcincta TaxID=45464 RepID=A0A2G9TWQ9_TELCI|nr:7 transmembrane receptor [Teladorsagia circumcincta]